MENVGKVIIGVSIALVAIYMVMQIGLVIGDKFTTSTALAINATANPEGAAAQTDVNTQFYSNQSFMSVLTFIMIAAAAIYILLSSLGGLS